MGFVSLIFNFDLFDTFGKFSEYYNVQNFGNGYFVGNIQIFRNILFHPSFIYLFFYRFFLLKKLLKIDRIQRFLDDGQKITMKFSEIF